MKQNKTEIIILKRLNFSEADRIITAISSDHGKLSLFAKGVRRSKSKLAGGLELFSVSEVSFIDGRSELKTIVSSRLKAHFSRITNNMDATMLAYEFVKLTDKATENSCEPEYFDLLSTSLNYLNGDNLEIELIKPWFAVKLLELSGQGINTAETADGAKLKEGCNYMFNFEDMVFVENESGAYNSNHIKFLRTIVKFSDPSNLNRIVDGKNIATEISGLLNHCLNLYY